MKYVDRQIDTQMDRYIDRQIDRFQIHSDPTKTTNIKYF